MLLRWQRRCQPPGLRLRHHCCGRIAGHGNQPVLEFVEASPLPCALRFVDEPGGLRIGVLAGNKVLLAYLLRALVSRLLLRQSGKSWQLSIHSGTPLRALA